MVRLGSLRHRSQCAACCAFFLSAAWGTGWVTQSAAQESVSEVVDSETHTILPGDSRFQTPDFTDYQAAYTSSSSKTGGFTLQARKSGDGKKLSLIDIIPMQENIIVSQRVLDLQSHLAEFSAGPYFAWGAEFVVGQSTEQSYNWTRVPIGEGEPVQIVDELENGGYITEMFSPTLAALMPMPVGTKFHMPSAVPRIGDEGAYVTSDLDEYEVLRREHLDLEAGFSCTCWLVERRTTNGMKEQIWVSREAPFVFRRIRDLGGPREFTSDLLAFQSLDY